MNKQDATSAITRQDRRHRARRGLAMPLAAVLALVFTVLGISSIVRAAAAGSCTIPTSDITVTAQDTTSGSTSSVSGWDDFKFTTTLSNLDGLPAGCTATEVIPSSLFSGMQATTLYLNADGTFTSTPQADTVAVMSVDPTTNTVTFTTTDYPSTHTGVSATGWVTAKLNDSLQRGVTVPIGVTVNGVTQPGTVTTVTCTTDCAVPPSQPAKWGVENADGSGYVTIQTPAAGPTGTTITVADALDSTDQEITGVMSVAGFNCVNTWGSAGVLQTDGSCDTSATVPATVTQNASSAYVIVTTVPNEFFNLTLNMHFSGSGPWSDTATITIAGTPYTIGTTVVSYNAGGGATGTSSTSFTESSTSTSSSSTSSSSTESSTSSAPVSSSTSSSSPRSSTSSSTGGGTHVSTSSASGPVVVTDGPADSGRNAEAIRLGGVVLVVLGAVTALLAVRLRRN